MLPKGGDEMPSSRTVIVHTQVTLDNRISRADGFFWEPFAYGEPETAYVNRLFERADTNGDRIVDARDPEPVASP